jgi:hypothetical protein
MTGMNATEVASQMRELAIALHEETIRFADLSEASALAESRWKRAVAAETVAARSTHPDLSIADRAAYVTAQTGDLYEGHLILHNRRQASRESLASLRAQIDVLRFENSKRGPA